MFYVNYFTPRDAIDINATFSQTDFIIKCFVFILFSVYKSSLYINLSKASPNPKTFYRFVSAEAPTCDLWGAHEGQQGMRQQAGVPAQEPSHQARALRRGAACWWPWQHVSWQTSY